jgi:hypothetical protein
VVIGPPLPIKQSGHFIVLKVIKATEEVRRYNKEGKVFPVQHAMKKYCGVELELHARWM